MNKKKLLSFAIALLLGVSSTFAQKQPVDYVNPLMGTDSKISLSNGNTYPAIALPWGMNFWMPQTGKMGDGWAYTYASDKIRGFKQTHQPSPWINDYGQFAIMPITGKVVFNQDKRASWFSHKAEVAKPNYYRVYLADHDVVTEITPFSSFTSAACLMLVLRRMISSSARIRSVIFFISVFCRKSCRRVLNKKVSRCTSI